MPTLEKVTNMNGVRDFCLTDCGPSEGCNPDDFCPPKKEDKKDKKA